MSYTYISLHVPLFANTNICMYTHGAPVEKDFYFVRLIGTFPWLSKMGIVFCHTKKGFTFVMLKETCFYQGKSYFNYFHQSVGNVYKLNSLLTKYAFVTK